MRVDNRYDGTHETQTPMEIGGSFTYRLRFLDPGVSFTVLFRGPTGDARGTSQNGLTAEFLGDYNSIEATNGAGVAVYNDARNAADCPAIDAFRADLSSPPPAPGTDCPTTFGNSDIFGGTFADPTP